MTLSIGQKARWGAWATCASVIAVVLVFLYSNLNRETGPNLIIWVLQSLPLLLFLPGIMYQQRRALTWLCFVLLLYFIKAVEGVFMSNAGQSDLAFLLLTVSTFVVAVITIRWLQRL